MAGKKKNEAVLLLLQVSEQDALGNLVTVGYAIYDLVPNGATRYGTHEYDLYQPPIALKPTHSNEPYKKLGLIRFSILRPNEVYDAGEFIPSTKP